MIQFKELIPQPLAGTDLSDSGLWFSKEQAINGNETVLIFSPSGRGKTSFLSFVYGFRKDFTGSINLFDRDIHSYTASEWEGLRKNRISAVFQGLKLFPSLSAMDNIAIKNDITNHTTESEIIEMAKQLEMDSFLGQRLETLSFGQQQRIAIIRALCQPFDLLLLDEPFSHIDTQLQAKAWQLIQEKRKQQNASVIITLLHKLDSLQTDKIFTI